MLKEVALEHSDYSWDIAGLDFVLATTILADTWSQSVLDDNLAPRDLRAGLAWLRALDAEACVVYGSNLENGAQVAERYARRVLHHAGKLAVDNVGTTDARFLYQIRQQPRALVQ